MHEYSLVRNLLTQVKQIADDHGSTDVVEIEVEIGPLSGVDPKLLELAFEALQPESCAPAAELTIRHIPLRVRCKSCRVDSDLKSFHFQCCECGSGAVDVIQGDAIRLLSISLNESSDASSAATSEEVSTSS